MKAPLRRGFLFAATKGSEIRDAKYDEQAKLGIS